MLPHTLDLVQKSLNFFAGDRFGFVFGILFWVGRVLGFVLGYFDREADDVIRI